MRKPTGRPARSSVRVDEFVSRGLAAHQSGRLDEAAAAYDRALAVDPDHAAANHLRGLVHLSRGAADQAVALLARAVAASPGEARYLSNFGVALNAAGRSEEALVALDRALLSQPGFAEAHSNRGMVLRALKRHDEAQRAYLEAVWLRPDEAGFHFNLGNVLEDMGDFHEAIDSYSRAAALKPGYGRAHAGLSRVLLATGDADAALESARRAVAAAPAAVESHQALGRVLREQERLAEAEQAFQQALALSPQHAEVLSSLARIRVASEGDGMLERLERAYADPAQPPLERARLGFALGKVLGDLGRADAAVATFAEAGALQRRLVGFDIDAGLARLARIADNATFDAAHAVTDSQTAAPIFLIGLPRSGKSTLEAALARDPDVAPLGELHQFPRMLGRAAGSDPSFAKLSEMPPAGLSEIGRGYVQYVERLARGRTRTIDTLPANFEWVPFILATLPNARIIHCIRDPLAHCVAMYEKLFGQGGYGFSYDLHDLATYYRAYRQLTDRWQAMFGPRLLTVDTSPLVAADPTAWKVVYDFCGLLMPGDQVGYAPQTEPELGDAARRSENLQARTALYSQTLLPVLSGL